MGLYMQRLLLFFFAVCCALGADPCVDATAACTEKVAVGTKSGYIQVYRSHALTRPATEIRRAMIIVHGATRNADHYFSTGVAAAFLAKALPDALVIAPRFAVNDGRSSKDALAEGELSWESRIGWAGGGEAKGQPDISTYDAMDAVVRLLAAKQNFPNLRSIVVSGHSAGGQFTNRYAALNKLHETIGVPMRYVASNPSTMLYLDELRPARDGQGGFRPYYDRENCATYNDYKYGLEKLSGYAARLTPEKIRSQYASRPVTYLIGELDTLPIAGFDSTCVAMAQGPDRFARAKAYFEHVTKRHGAKHDFVPVPLCGHNNRCVWTADVALPVLFPKP
jgi:pimeloyl-ACP methyl ester carboxylesterase